MKKLLTALSMCFGTFSVIPSPHKYDAALRPLAVGLMPLVGAVHAAVWGFVIWLALWLNIPRPLIAAIAAFLPYALSGSIHLDGFMDVSDAVLSRRPMEEKRRILKDSRVGAFAVISLVMLLIFSFAAWLPIADDRWLYLQALPVFAVSRICSALAVFTLSPMDDSQYASMKRRPKLWLVYLPLFLALLAGAYIWLGVPAFVGATAAFAAYWGFALFAKRQLGGFNGDCAGYALTLSELIGVICAIIIRTT